MWQTRVSPSAQSRSSNAKKGVHGVPLIWSSVVQHLTMSVKMLEGGIDNSILLLLFLLKALVIVYNAAYIVGIEALYKKKICVLRDPIRAQ